MDIKIYDNAGACVSRSKNLRGILAYSRAHETERIDLYKPTDGWSGGQFGIAWKDGATAICDFADFSIMEGFAKKKTFGGATVKLHQKGEATKCLKS